MKNPILILLVFFSFISFSIEKKEINAVRIQDEIELDGELNEIFWASAPVATNFIQQEPRAGEPSERRTEVRIVYDDRAIYVGATLFDERDSMMCVLSERDDFGNADWFGLVVDPYNAGTIGFAFLVTSAGVQIDELHNVAEIDANWNAVWQSEVQLYSDRWVVEMMIPFSAIRFPANSVNDWGITFARNIRRKREQSFWNFFDPTGLNLLSQLGVLKGVKDVDAPLRLSVTPYVSAYYENSETGSATTANGGLDLKWGVNEAFTVDMTLIPDFGQVQFDNQVLNLSPFEVFYNERRQFFTEGTELFNKAQIFYSRRIGGRPIDYWSVYDELDSTEIVTNNPESAQLINATKFSGRTKKGSGIGVFNGVTARMDAEITDTISGNTRLYRTAPLTNYNVFVFDQNLVNNSSVSITNTNVWREGNAYDANVTSFILDYYTKDQKFNYWGIGNLSQRYDQGSTELGHLINAGIEKSSGKFQTGLVYLEANENYNPNDLGFWLQSNIRVVNGYSNYYIYKPFWRLYRMWIESNYSYSRLINPSSYMDVTLSANVGGTFRNFMTAGLWVSSQPVWGRDYFEPRMAGRFYETPAYVAAGGFISSDYSKPFALDVNGGMTKFDDEGRYYGEIRISPRVRVSDNLFIVSRTFMSYANNDEGAAVDLNFSVPVENNNPIFAIRDQYTVENTISATYIFTNRMGLTFRLRHYWSKVRYDSFYELNSLGQFDPTTYLGSDANDQSLHNNSFNAFTIDMAYRWVFAPGSELSLVWKNSLFDFDQEVEANYFQNVNSMFDSPFTNSISLKILYYLDYTMVKDWFKKD